MLYFNDARLDVVIQISMRVVVSPFIYKEQVKCTGSKLSLELSDINGLVWLVTLIFVAFLNTFIDISVHK